MSKDVKNNGFIDPQKEHGKDTEGHKQDKDKNKKDSGDFTGGKSHVVNIWKK